MLKYALLTPRYLIANLFDFYIDDDYVTAVGNKADGMIGFTGYICELYDVDTGKMLAYL